MRMTDVLVIRVDPSGISSMWGLLQVPSEATGLVVGTLAEAGVDVDPERFVPLSINEYAQISIDVMKWAIPAWLTFLAARAAQQSVRIKIGDDEIEVKGPKADVEKAAQVIEKLRQDRIQQVEQRRAPKGSDESCAAE